MNIKKCFSGFIFLDLFFLAGLSKLFRLLFLSTLAFLLASCENSISTTPQEPEPLGDLYFVSANSAFVDEGISNYQHIVEVISTKDGEISYSIEGGSANLFSITSQGTLTAVLTFNGTLDYETKNFYSITIKAVNEASNDSNIASFTLHVNNINDNPPYFTVHFPSRETLNENSPIHSANGVVVVFDSLSPYGATDGDNLNDKVTFSVNGTDSNAFSINPTTGKISFITAPDYENPTDSDKDNVYEFSIVLDDGKFTSERAFAVTVADVDDAIPYFTDTEVQLTMSEGGTTTIENYIVQAQDPDGGASLTYSAIGVDGVSIINGSMVFNPQFFNYENPLDADQDNVYHFEIVAKSNNLYSTSSTQNLKVVLTVENIDDTAPFFTTHATVLTIDENYVGVIYTANATDVDTPIGGLSYISTASSRDLTLDANTGELSFVSPRPDYETQQQHIVILQVSDGVNDFPVEQRRIEITININNLNDTAPTITSHSGSSVDENDKGRIEFLANDLDGDDLTFSIDNAGDGGLFRVVSVDSVDGDAHAVITFAASPDYESPQDVNGDNKYAFDVRVSDGVHESTPTSIVIEVNNLNDNPHTFSSTSLIEIDEGITARSIVHYFGISDPDGVELNNYYYQIEEVSGDESLFSMLDPNHPDNNIANFSSTLATAFAVRNPIDYENPADADKDNIYNIKVAVYDANPGSDYAYKATQTLQVKVNNIFDFAQLSLSGTQVKNLQFNWQADSLATSYELREESTMGAGFTEILNTNTATVQEAYQINGITTSPVDVLLSDIRHHQFVLVASDANGNEVESPIVSFFGDNRDSRDAQTKDAIGYFKAPNGKGQSSDSFGQSVAIAALQNDVVLAFGAPVAPLDRPGSVYIYNINGQSVHLQASDKENGDYFGSSISVSADGNTLVVGASGKKLIANDGVTHEYSGQVYVFTRSGNNSSWTEQAKLQINDDNYGAADGFGTSVAVNADGSVIAVGSSGKNVATTSGTAEFAGMAYVFALDANNNTWSTVATMTAGASTSAGGAFGESISLNGVGDVVVVGAPASSVGAPANNIGTAHIFTNVGNSSWTEIQILTAGDQAGPGYRFGNSVHLSQDGQTLAIGSSHENTTTPPATEVGAVYIFTVNNGSWTEQGRLQANNPGEKRHFGTSVALSHNGDVLAVGATGENGPYAGVRPVYPYDSWNQDDANTNAAGAAYIFKRDNNNSWGVTGHLKASNPGGFDAFGISVSLDGLGNNLVVGAPYEDGGGSGAGIGVSQDDSVSDSGAAYIY